ncbi:MULTISPECIES: sensor histidine kinase [Streptomyces]|uniref:histidine kinase n=1 Tax=Streptomyces lasiicapitis TaxID=1923961 RepID=A0ABQ2N0H4_9ACTN|nr:MULTISPECIES: HAMP domain-containing sensor histidine kinase [Streptomyces]QIB47812.1 HAMP domain-containing histidine kinase [Streptomyces aureoverticillatus]GGO59397.1 two-component sensor histidine kinase [Streptomyces lasiicapitis]
MGNVRSLLHWRSLRWKIALLVAVACGAIALTVGLLVHRSTYERSVNDGAAKAYSVLDTALGSTDPDDASGLVHDPAQMPPELVREARAHGQAHVFDESNQYRPEMWASRRLPDGQLVAVSVDMTPDQLSRAALDRHMWKYSLLVLAVVVSLSALAAELPNRRLRQVARTARRIETGDLDARTRMRGRTGDEIAEISGTVDSMADSLRDRVLSEQRFTADVAHELRTPLMGLVTSAELLPESEATDLVRDRVRVLRTLVEDLLEISRLDAGVEHAELRPVDLAEAVRESLARTGLEARLTVDNAPVVAETDPRRLDRILANLVINAHRHGSAPVEVTIEGTTIVVRDHGPGFPDSLLTEGPQRFRTGTAERGRGHGLGLTVATGQAHVIGASLGFSNAAEGGAVATLRLPSTDATHTRGDAADMRRNA